MTVFTLTHLPEASKTGFGQVKIMKEFVWINRKLPGRWKKLRQTAMKQWQFSLLTEIMWNMSDVPQMNLYVVMHSCDSVWSFWVRAVQVFFIISLYMYVVLIPQLSEVQGTDPINRSNPIPFLCLSQARTRIFHTICCALFLYSMAWVERWFVCFVYIGGIVSHHCLNFLHISIIVIAKNKITLD